MGFANAYVQIQKILIK